MQPGSEPKLTAHTMGTRHHIKLSVLKIDLHHAIFWPIELAVERENVILVQWQDAQIRQVGVSKHTGGLAIISKHPKLKLFV